MGETETNSVTKIRATKFNDISQFACQSNAFVSEFSDLLVRKLVRNLLACTKMFLI